MRSLEDPAELEKRAVDPDRYDAFVAVDAGQDEAVRQLVACGRVAPEAIQKILRGV